MKEIRYKELNSVFMKQYSDIFSKKLPSRLSPENDLKHCIILKDDESINDRLMHVSIKFWPAMQRFIDINLKAGRLRPSSSHISAGTFMISKKSTNVDSYDVHDYRALNEKIVKDHISSSRQNEILELLIKIIVHGKIDLINAYYQIRMHSNDIHKTIIKTPFGLYE